MGLAALVLYLLLAPTVPGEGDSGEFMLVLAVGGVPHPTGYPLYVLLGHLFVTWLHGWGAGWAWAANAWSALGAGLAVFGFHALAVRLIPARLPLGTTARFLVALVPTWLLALDPVWLPEATVAEVHSWHLALVLAGALLALRLFDGLEARGPAPGRPGRVMDAGVVMGAALWGLLAGVMLAHHRTSVLFLAPLTLGLGLAVTRARGWGGWVVPATASAMLVPLLSYAFVVYRAAHPAAYQWPHLEPTAASVLAHIRGGIFAVYLGHFDPAPGQRALLARAVWPFLLAGLPLLAWAAWRAETPGRRTFLLSLLAAAMLQVLFVLVYGVGDPAPYLLPAVAAALLAFAIAGGRLTARLPHPAAAIPLLAGCAVAGAFWVQGQLSARREYEGLEVAIRERWEAIPFDRGFVIWAGDHFTRLRGYQILEGSRPGLHVENPNDLTWEAPRRAFVRRYGFDPLAGLQLREQSEIVLVAPNIARQTRLPVVDFDRFRP